ncbi:MAG: SUF system NifU family Fe-S cluster assembly protein [Candidatus Aenigmarchaeota archaeon]|nr:SUF system NifU family Fe-S cluster assembly protein [Candidatus Aenigmarchaeota archaeon]
MNSEMYGEIILDYYRNPKNFGKLDRPNIVSRDANPLCGDIIEIQLKISKDKKISDVRFNGNGCAISRASASMLTELIKDKTLNDIVKLSKKDVLDLLGIELSHVRMKCALLPLKALKLGVYGFLGKTFNEKEM